MRRLDSHIPELIDRMAAGRDGPVAIAVSGGSDSTALLHLTDIWSKRAGRPLLVLTVDHGLRPEAAEEAASVAAMAGALGHAAKILRWTPDKAGQQAARRARHRLIAEAAREAGAGLILLGHTFSDLEETLLMRLARPTTLVAAAGPQAVSVSPVWPEGRGLLIARPLLGTDREALRDWLRGQGTGWIEDPSNDADAYERVRLRRLIAGLDRDRLARITADAVCLRALEDARLCEALFRVRVDRAGLIEVARWPAAPRLQYRLLSLLLQAAAGSDRAGNAQAVEAACAEIADGGPEARLTLAGGWIQRRGGRLLIGRDPGEMDAGWKDGVWDGRYMREAGAAPPEEVAFLVRHAVPHGEGWREIISERLALWREALRLGAVFSVELAGSAVTTRPG